MFMFGGFLGFMNRMCIYLSHCCEGIFLLVQQDCGISSEHLGDANLESVCCARVEMHPSFVSSCRS